MRIIFDTNVLVSAILRDRGPQRAIEWVLERPDIEWVASEEILSEYRDVLHRAKFGLSKSILEGWLTLLDETITKVAADAEIRFPRDRKDAAFLSCALRSGAHYLITGDRDFSEARKLVDTTIISVSLFLKHICREQ